MIDIANSPANFRDQEQIRRQLSPAVRSDRQLTHSPTRRKLGMGWFLPFITKYRLALIEVLIASFFVQLLGLANPLMTQVIVDKVLVQNSSNTLQILGILLLVLNGFEALLTSLRTHLFAATSNQIDLALGTVLINHLLRLPLRYFEQRSTGELSNRIYELENVRQFLTTTALGTVMDVVFSIVYIGVMFLYSWQLTIVALLTLPLFVGLTLIAAPLTRRQLRQKGERRAENQSYLIEILSGIQTVKAQNLEARSAWHWHNQYTRYIDAGFKTVQTSTITSSTSQFLNQLSNLLVLWVGATLVLKGQITLGQLVAFRILANYVTSPLLRLSQLWQNFQQIGLSLERVSDIINTPTEREEFDRPQVALPEIRGHVQYENVAFRFQPNGPLQLESVSAEFTPGSFVGIVGASGSGKSTLMKLLSRLYPLASGRILIDGYDINQVELASLRQQIGVVPQEPLLFSGTILENITLNRPTATEAEVIAAAKVAAAHDFIMTLPKGYHTPITERGNSLSGGQRQRLTLARTVLQNPRLLVLDEATSALDYTTEQQICTNLAHTFKGRTVFLITHRLNTLRHADVIVVMERGAIVERGTHDELMACQGRYFHLYQQQSADQ